MGNFSKHSNVEELKDREDPTHQEFIETLSEIKVLKKSLQYFKDQNKYLNDSNYKLMIATWRLREDLEEINARY